MTYKKNVSIAAMIRGDERRWRSMGVSNPCCFDKD
jgi:hypothetical protein